VAEKPGIVPVRLPGAMIQGGGITSFKIPGAMIEKGG